MRHNIKKSYSPAAFHTLSYGSSFSSLPGGFNKVHHGVSSHKISHGNSGVFFGGANKSHLGHSKITHHNRVCSPTSGLHRSSSAHGGLGSKEFSHSSLGNGQALGYAYDSQSHGSHSEGYGSRKNNSILSINEKETMQYLNGRLASYLEKVRSLEEENTQLEKNICEWFENNAPSTLPDSSEYIKTIEELQNQISAATVENAKIALQIDNAKWATDDFRNKYDIEVRLRSNVEADVRGLQGVLEGLNKEKCDLDVEVQELEEELNQMKKNHEEEVNSLRCQLGARVNVEVDATPSVDLNKVLCEIREEYEGLMERNLRDVEAMFLARTEELSRQLQCSSENLQSVQIEILDLRRSVQNLENDLQSQLNMKAAIQDNLTETEANYSAELAQLQRMIDNVQSELVQIRYDLECQNSDYRTLMDQKNHLEMEITTYKSLLDGQDCLVSEATPPISCFPEELHPTVPQPPAENTSEASC